jgi:hypothetical protein
MAKFEKTDRGNSIPDCFRNYNNCDPEGAKHTIDSMWDEIYKAAEVDEKKFNHAMNRVYLDGYFGPISQESWDEENQGAKGLTVTEAREIVEKGMAAVSDVEYCDPDYDCEYDREIDESSDDYVPQNNCIIEAKYIKHAMFKFYYEIYVW